MTVLWKEVGRAHVFHELIPPKMSTKDRLLCTLLEYIRTYLDPNIIHSCLFTGDIWSLLEESDLKTWNWLLKLDVLVVKYNILKVNHHHTQWNKIPNVCFLLKIYIEQLKYLYWNHINIALSLFWPPPFSCFFLMSDKSDILTIWKGLELIQSD